MTTNSGWSIEDGRKLRDLRRARNLSQNALAKKLGCDQGTVSRIENGFPPSKPVRIILDILKGSEHG